MDRAPRIMISAGEASGDRLGAGLARALRERRPEIELLGMGGELMREAGVRLLQDASEVAVVGIVEVLSHLPALRRAMGTLTRALDVERPDLLVPIDFPDFNLRLSARAKRFDVPVVYFVSPQIWAWRRGRVHGIGRLVRRMLVLFPFETRFYEQAGVPVNFVGHPVAETAEEIPSREELCGRAGLDPGRRTVALLPGSRRIEIARLASVMLDAAKILQRDRRELQFLVPVAPGLDPAALRQQVAASGLRDCRLHTGDFPAILSVCDAGVVASGTASLQAAVVGMPMVVVYRVGALSHMLGKMLLRVDSVALPNLVAGRRVVPELIQGELRAEAVAAILADYLDRPGTVEEVRRGLREVRQRLGGGGVFERAAELVLAELASGQSR